MSSEIQPYSLSIVKQDEDDAFTFKYLPKPDGDLYIRQEVDEVIASLKMEIAHLKSHDEESFHVPVNPS